MAKNLNTRAAAAKLSWQIIDKGQSLDLILTEHFEHTQPTPQDKGFTQELVYGICRWYGKLNAMANQLLNKPIRNKDRVVHFIILVGLYQLHHLKTADHAAIGETVNACKQLNKQWAKNLVNGCLRHAQRMPIIIDHIDQITHPDWIVAAIKADWPEYTEAIFKANNQRPPMCLRVNRRLASRDAYLQTLISQQIMAHEDPYSEDGIILEQAVTVSSLPGFAKGVCSVQDTAAQLACDFIQAKPGMSVLDACAAPGGKTAHMLERTDDNLHMHALDISERRCEQLYDTLSRLELNAQVYCADASKASSWPIPETGYDRILIDAPCSGLGVIRRHPDIKHHRRPDDVITLTSIQSTIMNKLWPCLKPGGFLLYMTCSVLKCENSQQVEAFLSKHSNASVKKLAHPNAIEQTVGVQTLPGVHNMDGFYYCLIQKQA